MHGTRSITIPESFSPQITAMLLSPVRSPAAATPAVAARRRHCSRRRRRRRRRRHSKGSAKRLHEESETLLSHVAGGSFGQGALPKGLYCARASSRDGDGEARRRMTWLHGCPLPSFFSMNCPILRSAYCRGGIACSPLAAEAHAQRNLLHVT